MKSADVQREGDSALRSRLIIPNDKALSDFLQFAVWTPKKRDGILEYADS